jgi:Fe-S cluster assembly protein SufD
MTILASHALRDYYCSAFPDFMAKRHDPDSITELRYRAFERFKNLGLPNLHQEDWRFTDLSAIDKLPLKLPADAQADPITLPDLGSPTHRLVFVNGRFISKLSKLAILPGKVAINSISRILETTATLVESLLERTPGLAQHPFAALNTAFWEDGACLYLPCGTIVEQPIHVIFYSTGGDMAVHPRLLLVIEKYARAKVIVEYLGNGPYLNVPIAEIHVGDEATLEYHHIQEESLQSFHIGGIRVQQGCNSQTRLHLMSFGGQLARTDIEVFLEGEKALCLLNGLIIACGIQTANLYARIEHSQKHGTSQQSLKSVLDGKACSLFNSTIHVCSNAQKTDAHQNIRNLLLSRQALAHSSPKLEIFSDDVKCGHGSSTGFLDPMVEFYIRTRGIDAIQARAMLVCAFANDIFNQVHIEQLRERLSCLLANRLKLTL